MADSPTRPGRCAWPRWLMLTGALGAASVMPGRAQDRTAPIRIGIIHSQTGTMAISETPLVSAAQLAVDEINAAGGVRGRPLEAIVVDLRSDWDRAAREAEHLLSTERVTSLFGCWTSACRQAVVPVLQRIGGLLWYPVQYEGRESSPSVIYTGATPNQQILPAIDWAAQTIGRRFFLIGSDYVFPRTAHLTIRERASALGVRIVGETYIPLGSTDVKNAVAQIVDASPDIIINTINGDTNVNFFFELAAASANRRIPILSFSIAENEIRTIGTRLLQGHYVAWNYFQSLDTPDNQAFVAAYRRKLGQSAVTSDPIEAAYFQVRMFAEAVADAPDTTPTAIRTAAEGLSFVAPGGYVRIDGNTHHTWKTVRLGEIMFDGQIRSLLDSVVPVQPLPFASAQDAAPRLFPRASPQAPATPATFLTMLADPAQAPSVVLTLRSVGSTTWSTEDRLGALLGAARSPNFAVRYEAARAAERLTVGRSDIIAALLESADPSDLEAGLRLLRIEEMSRPDLMTRALALTAHSARRVRLAAGEGLLAHGARGWTASADPTSRIIKGFQDRELGVRKTALELSQFSTEFDTRIAPLLAQFDFSAQPEFFRRHMCEAVARVIGTRTSVSGERAASALERAAVQLEQGRCLDAEEMTRVHAGVARAAGALNAGIAASVARQFRENFITTSLVAVSAVLMALNLLGFVIALGLWWIRPAALITLLRRMTPLRDIRLQLWGLDLNLFNAVAATWMKGSRRALRAWTHAQVGSYRNAFTSAETVRERATHVLLAAMFPDQPDPLVPDPERVRQLTAGRTVRVQIVGEGGTGKTSLACQFGRWATSAHPAERFGPSEGGNRRSPMLAVLFEPGQRIPAEGSLVTVFARKLTPEREQHPLPDWLVASLISYGFVLAILDDPRDIDGFSAEAFGAPEMKGLSIVATVREEMPAGIGELVVIRPQKLRGYALTEFCVAYIKASGRADQVGDDIERYIRQFKQLLGPQEDVQETVVYFARLFIDFVLEVQRHELGSQRRPQSVPELVESFVSETCRHAEARHGINRQKVVGLVLRTAHLAISDRQRTGVVTLQALAAESPQLRAQFGLPDTVNIEEALVDTGLIDQRAQYLRFKIDLVQEYCAVLHVRDQARMLPTRDEVYHLWKDWVDQIVAGIDVEPKSSGLLKAILEFLRSDRVAAMVPPGLIELVAAHLGVSTTSLQPIKIGILHSLQGTLAMSELPLRDAALLAVDEINRAGGIGGRMLVPVIRDGESDPAVFAREAARLVRDDGVASIFGCWTSITRKMVKSVVEAERSLLWYPIQYEGYEKSDAIIYTGAAPNQQILPAVDWCLRDLLPGRGVAIPAARFYLVGSDYVFPRRANAIVRRRLRDEGLDAVGEQYVPLASDHFEAIVQEIEHERPDVIINTINGSSNIAFFTALHERGLHADRVPVVSLSIAEGEIRDIGPERLRGHFAVWNYFQSLPHDANQTFIRAFRERYGMGRVTSDPIATAYTQVKLFAEAARRAGALTPEDLRAHLETVKMDTPAGRIQFDRATGHFSKHVYVGKVNADGQFEIVTNWKGGDLVAPDPFPYSDLTERFSA